MDNRAPDYEMRLPENAGHLLRDALNVDTTTAGHIRRREGFERMFVGTSCHSLWSPPTHEYALYVDGTQMFRIGHNGVKSVLAGGMVPGRRVSYAYINGAVFASDGARKWTFFAPGGMPAWGDGAGTVLQGRALQPVPAGQHVCFHVNRFYSASGDTIFVSEPFAPHLYDPATGFERFPGRITMLAATEGGVYLGADATYFIPGGFPGERVQLVAPEPPVEWSDTHDTDSDTVFWMSPRGLMRGTPSGEVQALQEQRVEVARALSGATAVRNRDGIRSIISVLSEPDLTQAAASSFINARLVRKAPP